MKALADLIIAAVELIETEARQLRLWSYRLGAGLALLFAAAALGVGGVLLLAAAVFVAMQQVMGTATTLLVLGLVLSAVAGAIGWTVHRNLK